MKMTLRITDRVRIGHRIQGHPKCKNVHGEYLTIRIYVTGNFDYTTQQYLVDFGELKKILHEEIQTIDHAYLFRASSPFVDEVGEFLSEKGFKVVGLEHDASCEYLTIWFKGRLEEKIRQLGVRLTKIEIFESSPDSLAILEI